ncbi:MAG: NTP transferase domain-containing protein [Deltaproteobacteria bacterium]|nr:NTP transferase domain-containing protein [Deltaproteobacteria bacterium]
MIRMPNMLLIGAAGRNVGKTELACALIAEHKKSAEIVAVKVTAITEKGGEFRHGAKGGKVCASLGGSYEITEEISPPPHKDTGRMVIAGANKVFWLKVHRDSLNQGLEALLSVTGHDKLIVCESTSLRLVVEPGIFLMVKDKFSDDFKPSAEEVRDLADRIVLFANKNHDLQAGEIKIIPYGWSLPLDANAVIMAGGKSTRMGQDKSSLQVGGKTLLEHVFSQIDGHFNAILVSAAEKTCYESLGDVRVVADEKPGEGPLMGILSSLEQSEREINFVLACDIPEIPLFFIRKMVSMVGDFDCVIPVNENGRIETLFGVYKKSMINPIREALAGGKRRIRDVFDTAKVNYVKLDQSVSLRNLNTLSDYHAYLQDSCSFRATAGRLAAVHGDEQRPGGSK